MTTGGLQARLSEADPDDCTAEPCSENIFVLI